MRKARNKKTLAMTIANLSLLFSYEFISITGRAHSNTSGTALASAIVLIFLALHEGRIVTPAREGKDALLKLCIYLRM